MKAGVKADRVRSPRPIRAEGNSGNIKIGAFEELKEKTVEVETFGQRILTLDLELRIRSKKRTGGRRRVSAPSQSFSSRTWSEA